jgi:hypothetical protein
MFGAPDLAPFSRLASARARLTETAARGPAPMLGMAGFLAGWSGLEDRGGGPGRIGREAAA